MRAAVLALAPVLLLAPPPPPAGGAGEPPAPLALVALEVEPASPAPDTLCTLRVRVANRGERTASELGFELRIDGREVPAVAARRYLDAVEPGATVEIRLPNFWSTERGRPVPADGELRVEVALTEARWVHIERAGDAEIREPLAPVEGLPVRLERSLPIAPAR